MKFSRVLRETRERMKLSQAVMAEKLGVSRASLSLYECGKQTPDLFFLDKLHRLTGAPLDYLMGYTDNHTEETVGIDKSLGLCTEAIEQIQNVDYIANAINMLAKVNMAGSEFSSALQKWADAATEYHDILLILNNNVGTFFTYAEDDVIVHAQQQLSAFALEKALDKQKLKAGSITIKAIHSIIKNESPIRNKYSLDFKPALLDALKALFFLLPEGSEKDKIEETISAKLEKEGYQWQVSIQTK